MKVTCESCGSKYTIKDEKVRGKRVKIRCKGCKNPIVVDGTALDEGGVSVKAGEPDAPASSEQASPAVAAQSVQAAAQAPATSTANAAAPARAAQPAAAPQVAATAPDETWSVNLTETDSRDMTTGEIVAAWGSGLVTDDAYVFKPGFADWQPILQVPELAQLLQGGGQAAPDAFAAPPGQSPYGAKAAPVQGRAQATGRSGDLFGAAAGAGSEEEHGSGPPVVMPGADGGKPTGARNESSVLFSLDALKAGFEPAPAAPAPATPSSKDDPFGLGAPAGLGGFGGGFDQNQALFSAPPPEPKKPKIPSLAPAADGESAGLDRNKLFMIGGAVLLLLIAVGGVGYALGGSGGKDETAQVADAEEGTDVGKARQGKAQDKSDDSDEKDAKKDDSEKKDEADEASSDKDAEKKDDDKADEDSGDKSADAKKADTDKAAGAGKVAAATPGAGADKSDKKDDKPAAAKEPAADDGSGAPPFNKSAAVSALSSAAGSAASCKIPGGPTGSGKVIVTFAPSGRVTTANVVGGKFGGTSVGGCVASRFRRARIPAFSGSAKTVSKSFSIQ